MRELDNDQKQTMHANVSAAMSAIRPHIGAISTKIGALERAELIVATINALEYAWMAGYADAVRFASSPTKLDDGQIDFIASLREHMGL